MHTALTMKHIPTSILDCPKIRQKYFTACSLKDIFESVDSQSSIDLIKDDHFYHHL